MIFLTLTLIDREEKYKTILDISSADIDVMDF